MKSKPTKKRVVKAWAVIGEQGHLAYENECPLVFDRKRDATTAMGMTDDVVPCTISYQPPTSH